ncbi:MAG: contractile injection system tape measure protein [Microscillaceae bacterium]|jgi:hypothetical protein|nr:contractile injection system tape measure protein [Microscillaceae bacterium]
MLHRILHPVFEFELNYSENQLPKTEQRLKNTIYQLLLPVLDEVLTEFAQSTYLLKINQLELDLGKIQLNDLENEAPYRLRSRLRERLTELIISQQYQLPNAPEIITYEQNAFESLNFFLETGRSAWWANAQTYQELFAELAQIAPQALDELWQNNAQSNNFVKRLIYQMPENQLLNWLLRGQNEKIIFIQKIIYQFYEFNQTFWQIPTPAFKLTLWRAIIEYLLKKPTLSSATVKQTFKQTILQKIIAIHQLNWKSFQKQLLAKFSAGEQEILNFYLADLEALIPQQSDLLVLFHLPLRLATQAQDYVRDALQSAIQLPDYQAINAKLTEKINRLNQATSPSTQAKIEELYQTQARNLEFNLPEKEIIALIEAILPQNSADLLYFVREIIAKADWFGLSPRRLQKTVWRLLINELSNNRYGRLDLRQILPKVLKALQIELKLNNVVLQNLVNRLKISYLKTSDLINNPDWEALQAQLIAGIAQELALNTLVIEEIIESYLIDNQQFIQLNQPSIQSNQLSEQFINQWFRGILQTINQQFNNRLEPEKIRQLLVNQGLSLAKKLRPIQKSKESSSQTAVPDLGTWREREFVVAIRQTLPLRATWLFDLVEQLSRLGISKLEIWQKVYDFVLKNKLFQKRQIYEYLKTQFPAINLQLWQKIEVLREEVQAELLETTYFEQLLAYWQKTEDLLWTEKIKIRLWQNRPSIEALAQKIGQTVPADFAEFLQKHWVKVVEIILPQIIDNQTVIEYLQQNFKTPTQFINALELFFKNQLFLPQGVKPSDLLSDFKQRFPQALNIYFTTLNPLEISLLASENPKITEELIAEKMAFNEELKQIQEAILENRFLPDTPENVAEADKIKKIQALKEALKQAQTTRKAWLVEPLYVRNAGVVLLHPYLSRLFAMLQLLDNKEFKGFAEACKAVYLLQYLVFKEYQGFEESDLILNKLLCGIDLDEPLFQDIEISEEEKNTCESLLQGVIANWTILGKTSPDALRNTFLQREGRLSEAKDAWILRVAQSGVDVLVERLPWGIGTIKLATMQKILTVEWV